MYKSLLLLSLVLAVKQSLGNLRLTEIPDTLRTGYVADRMLLLSNKTNDKKDSNNLVFYVISDVPYDNRQAVKLRQQLNVLPTDAEFLVHVGDIRSAGRNPGKKCTKKEYTDVANVLRTSIAPTFIVPGDNEWNDCPNIDEAFRFWKSEFNFFEQQKQWKNISSKFNVVHPPSRSENFRFQYKGVLFIGLNIVGGRVHNRTEWKERLTENFRWTSETILNYQKETIADKFAGRIVLFGHADPNGNHNDFFVPFQNFVQTKLNNTIPILYIHGDRHTWMFERNFLGQKSMIRISLVSEAQQPPLKMMVTLASPRTGKTRQPFFFDRNI